MKERGGGVTNACICRGTQIDGMLTKLDRDELIMALHMRLDFTARSGKWLIQGGAKIG